MTGDKPGKCDTLTAASYYEAALTLLGEEGVDGLSVNTLCTRLAVTKGSFYHHFDGHGAFVDGLLAHWVAEHSDRLIAASARHTDPVRRRAVTIDFAVNLPHAPEAALRAWARSNEVVAGAVARVDRSRERHVTETLIADGLGRDEARLFSRLALDVLVGQQMRERRLNRTRLRRSLTELSRLIFAGAPV